MINNFGELVKLAGNFMQVIIWGFIIAVLYGVFYRVKVTKVRGYVVSKIWENPRRYVRDHRFFANEVTCKRICGLTSTIFKTDDGKKFKYLSDKSYALFVKRYIDGYPLYYVNTVEDLFELANDRDIDIAFDFPINDKGDKLELTIIEGGFVQYTMDGNVYTQSWIEFKSNHGYSTIEYLSDCL